MYASLLIDKIITVSVQTLINLQRKHSTITHVDHQQPLGAHSVQTSQHYRFSKYTPHYLYIKCVDHKSCQAYLITYFLIITNKADNTSDDDIKLHPEQLYPQCCVINTTLKCTSTNMQHSLYQTYIYIYTHTQQPRYNAVFGVHMQPQH